MQCTCLPVCFRWPFSRLVHICCFHWKVFGMTDATFRVGERIKQPVPSPLPGHINEPWPVNLNSCRWGWSVHLLPDFSFPNTITKKISKLKTEKTTTNNQVVRQAGGRFLNYNMPCTQVKYAVQQGSQQRNQVWIYFCYLGCSFSKKQRNSLRSVYTPATTNRW